MSSSHVREYIKRVASIDQEQYPEWNLQKPLPKLPVPDLSRTLEKYIEITQPILTPSQYAKTKDIVRDFGKLGGEGEFLQTKLKEYSETKDNWAYNWWLDDMYMKVRLPLPISSNPGMVFPKQHFLDRAQQLRYASRLISGILDYKTIIDARGLPIDRARHKEKGQPLCMEQYYKLFTSYRIPGVKKDSLISNHTNLMPEPEHIIVICKNQFFVLDVINNFTRLSEGDLYTQLGRIYKMAEENAAKAEPIGILTAAYRDQWSIARAKLMEDSTNRDSLDAIERCIFVLCLDKGIPLLFNHQNSIDETNKNIRDDVSLAFQMLHGMGTNLNGANRWYDKTMQFVISEDGACGLNYEHSPSEGIAVVQLIEHLLSYMEEVRAKRLVRMNSVCELASPRKLQWKVFPEIVDSFNVASKRLDSKIEDLDLYILRFEEFGKEFPKSMSMSPDSFIQLSLQLTFYKIHKKLVSTYESASTRRFRLGRVDNIRANSPAALEWVKAMIGEVLVSDMEKMVLLRKAMQKQTEIMTENILGQGTDCHLLGLREMAVELGRPVPELFLDDGFRIANHFSLSTSQVPTTMDAFMCYGPVVPDGYGVCYNPHPHNILVCITSFKSHSETRSDYFAYTLESSFLQMQELCLKTSEAARPLQAVQENSHHTQNTTDMRNGSVTRLHNGDCHGSPSRSPRHLSRSKRVGSSSNEIKTPK
ncbi:choline O-acetyltransferase-like [Mytilus californianus]|uniref:choline O-acetyltransferase-like n=1 Tax=Mytilus californianus TaxID=6549 RepID=UPI0022453E5B|nr:choline O-acetyltransferase-like [Mytilus californianus]XP_052069854.1 choline O-acetyltransferase-like [Mytilus californianus]